MKETVWVKVSDKNKKVIIGNVYRHPDNSEFVNLKFFEELEDEITEIKFKNHNTEIFLVGDLNARVGEEIDILNLAEQRNGWEEEQYIGVANRINCRRNKDKKSFKSRKKVN